MWRGIAGFVCLVAAYIGGVAALATFCAISLDRKISGWSDRAGDDHGSTRGGG